MMMRQISNEERSFNGTRHQPDCSAISDAQLQKTIYSHWPIENGKTKIPYSVSTTPFWLSASPLVLYNYFVLGEPIIKNMISPIHLDEKAENQLRNSLKISLNQWQSISNGTIEFVEATDIYPWSRGIYAFVVNPDSMGNVASAFTLRKIDNNGEIKQAFIFFPNNQLLWGMENELMLPHELGHALGFEHLHLYPDIRKQIENTPDGVFCSVMPYPAAVSTNVSSCHPEYIDDCLPPYLTSPGSLDERMIKIAYQNESMNTTLTKRKIGDYILNASDAFISSMAIAGAHKACSSMLSHLAVRPHKPLIPEKASHFIVDASLLAAVIYLEFPIWSIATYTISTATKYLPETILDKSPKAIKFILTSNYSVWLINLSSTYFQGQKIIPLAATSIVSMCGSFTGTIIGYGIGRGSAWLINRIPQAITAKYFSNEPIEEIELQEMNLINQEEDGDDITIDILDEDNSSADIFADFLSFQQKKEQTHISAHIYSFFKRSFFSRLGNRNDEAAYVSEVNDSQELGKDYSINTGFRHS